MSITYSYITNKLEAPSWISPPLVRYLPCPSTFDHPSSLPVVFALLYSGNATVVNYKK